MKIRQPNFSTSAVLCSALLLPLCLAVSGCNSPESEASVPSEAQAEATEPAAPAEPAEPSEAPALAAAPAANVVDEAAADNVVAQVGECTGVAPRATQDAPAAGDAIECPTCLGSSTPNWALRDFQPESCGFGETYGLDQFQGKVTLVVLLSAGCGYCLSQAEKLEELWWELKAEGHDFVFTVVNQTSAAQRQSALLERATFPMFQATPDVNGWELHDGGKDDFYIYDADGMLRAMYPAGGAVETHLSSDEGYANIRNAMLHLLGEETALPGDGRGATDED